MSWAKHATNLLNKKQLNIWEEAIAVRNIGANVDILATCNEHAEETIQKSLGKWTVLSTLAEVNWLLILW